MPRSPRRLALALVALLAVAALPALAAAEPDPSLDRVFPDPLVAGDFVQWTPGPLAGAGPQYRGTPEDPDAPPVGIYALEERYPDVVDIQLIGDLVGQPDMNNSAGGRPIEVITLTDESVPGPKKDLYLSMSIHGLERAGLEGGVRFIEDLARGYYAERDGGEDFILTNGDPERPAYAEMTATQVLAESRLVFTNLNPDGWAEGDRQNAAGSAGFQRGNGNGIDLNRQWPTIGWTPDGERYETGSQPEAQVGRTLIEDYLGVPEGAADLHGELNDDVLLAIMFPGGQFDPLQLARQQELAASIKHNVNTSVHPGVAGLLSTSNVPTVAQAQVQPAEFHTAYDAIGYDDAGFQGDYLVQQGILEMDHEYAFSNLAPNNLFVPELEQIHVDTTRELLKATIVTTINAERVSYIADLGGDVGYVENPEVAKHTDPGLPAPPFGFAQEPYTADPMQYYRDLGQYAARGASLRPMSSLDVAEGALAGLDTVVVTNRDLPRYTAADGSLQSPDRAAFWSSLRAFAEAGGNVVLTDAAVLGLADLGVVAAEEVRALTQYAGDTQFHEREHPLFAGVEGVVGQTYFEVSMGYPVDGPFASPAYGVTEAAWEGAGGTIAAYVGSEIDPLTNTDLARGDVGVGTVALGEGQVSIFGALLPDPNQAVPHTQGLADYAVTYAGNAILVNALRGGPPTENLQPGEPDQPEDPDGSEQPEDPDQSEQPEDPDQSEQPEDPDQSEQPRAPGEPEVVRLAGADRVRTAAEVSARTFAPGAEVAYVATGEDFPDALAGGVAAALDEGPVLLVGDDVPDATAEELRRLEPGRIVVLGGTDAVSQDVSTALESFTDGGVTRLAGPDRAATAAAVSRDTFASGAPIAYVATGQDFPDALAGGAAAAHEGGPVLLAGRDDVPQTTLDELARLGPERVVLLGGPSAVSEQVEDQLGAATDAPVDRRFGATRYGTAAAVSAGAFEADDVSAVYLATGAAFPDALAGVPAAASEGAPLLLVERDRLPDETSEELRRLGVDRAVLLGGPEAVTPAVEAALLRAMGGE